MTTPYEIGKANAETAIDQRREFKNLKDALQNYYDNVLDTLGEVKATTDRDIEEATRGFQAVLDANKIRIKNIF